MKRLRLQPHRQIDRFLLGFITHSLYIFASSWFTNTQGSKKSGVHLPVEVSGILFQLSIALLAFLVVGFPVLRKGKAALRRLGLLRKPTLSALRKVLVLAIIVPLMEISLLAIFSYLLSQGESTTLPAAFIMTVGPAFWIRALFIPFIPAICEELLMRGALQPRIGIIWTSLLFSIIHVHFVASPIGPILFGFIFLESLLWGYLARRYGLWASMTMHSFNNAFSVLLPLLFQILFQR